MKMIPTEERPTWVTGCLAAATGVLIVMGACRFAHAQDQAPAAGVGADVAPGDRTIKVLASTGSIDKCDFGAAKPAWTPVKAGEVLGEAWVIRTGLNGSRVVLQLGDRSRVTIRGGTKLGISEFRGIEQEKVRTRLGLKYGSIHIEVDSSRGPNDYTVTDPVAISSVRGTGWDQAANVDLGYAHQNTHGSSNSEFKGTGTTRNTRHGEKTNNNATRHGAWIKWLAAIAATSNTTGQGTIEQHANNTNGSGPGAFSNAGGGALPRGVRRLFMQSVLAAVLHANLSNSSGDISTGP